MCLAGSFLCLNVRLFRIPPSPTFISDLLKAFANLLSFSSEISSSTITIALLTSPPFIRLFAIKTSSSCRKQKVLDDVISLLNSFIELIAAF